MDKTITYRRKEKLYTVNVSNPYSQTLHISVNGTVCSCATPKRFVKEIDSLLDRACDRYQAELDLGIIVKQDRP